MMLESANKLHFFKYKVLFVGFGVPKKEGIRGKSGAN